jgi:hypothetical protein
VISQATSLSNRQDGEHNGKDQGVCFLLIVESANLLPNPVDVPAALAKPYVSTSVERSRTSTFFLRAQAHNESTRERDLVISQATSLSNRQNGEHNGKDQGVGH